MLLAIGMVLLCASGDGGKVVVVAEGLKEPFGVDFDKTGAMVVVEMAGCRVLRMHPAGGLVPFAGTGKKADGGDGGPLLQASFNGPHHLLVGPDGNAWVADTWNWRVRKLDMKTATVTTVAGSTKGFSGDGGPADKAQFGGIYCIAFGPKGDKLYACDLDNRRIRAVDLQTGLVSTVAGNGEKGIPRDGAAATASPLADPRAVAVDSKGQLYILERGGNALRIVDAGGRIRTVVGTGKKGFSGDGGDALKAEMSGPKHLCCDRDDSVLIADAENHVIRRYTPKDGRIVRVAGTGRKGSGGVGGPPEQVELNRPHGVMVDSAGTVYISDSENHRVLRIEK
jgi:DNA-binding beta-propeller fold protein YncE